MSQQPSGRQALLGVCCEDGQPQTGSLRLALAPAFGLQRSSSEVAGKRHWVHVLRKVMQTTAKPNYIQDGLHSRALMALHA